MEGLMALYVYHLLALMLHLHGWNISAFVLRDGTGCFQFLATPLYPNGCDLWMLGHAPAVFALCDFAYIFADDDCFYKFPFHVS